MGEQLAIRRMARSCACWTRAVPKQAEKFASLLRRRRTRAHAAVMLLPLLASVLSFQAGCRAEEQWPLWEKYRDHFLDASGRVIDHSAADKTTSEGQAYGMFFALVVNDRKSFDRMLRWTEDNLAGGDLTARLPAWSWGKSPDGEWKQLDVNSAADADLWLAYDCLEAGRLWNDDRLTKMGAVLVNRMTHSDIALVPGVGTVVLPGPQGFHPAAERWVLNPSYMPPQVIARLRQQSPDGPWASVQEDLPVVLTQGAASGFAMDWLAADSAGVHPSSAPDVLAQGKTGTPAFGSYDAIRVYLWMGLADPRTRGVRESLEHMHGMALYLNTHVTPPLSVDAAGQVVSADAPPGFSAAVIPYLHAMSLKPLEKAQMDRLLATRDSGSGLYGRGGSYYDQNLALFATGWAEQRFHFEADGQLHVRWK